MSNAAYITRSSVCLPNPPVENDQVETILDRSASARRAPAAWFSATTESGAATT